MAESGSVQPQSSSPTFVSLGMVVLDEIRFSSRETLYNVPGGSGLYATLGARIIRSQFTSTSIGCLILAGYDFPESVVETLNTWGLALQVMRLPDKPSTKGLLQYKDDNFGLKDFQYVAPPLQPWPSVLDTSTLNAQSFHFLAAPDNLVKHVRLLSSLRKDHGLQRQHLIVWEPAPLFCNKEHLESHLQACCFIDVFSPNHLELKALVHGKSETTSPFSRELIQEYAQVFLNAGIGREGRGVIVVRCGEHGCLTMTKDVSFWLPSFYASASPQIVDTTGAGNAFLGGFTVGLQATCDLREAAVLGTVAASFALEQIGLPKHVAASTLSAERWNGARVASRIAEFKERLQV
ncbi:PfkB domain-containing protein [Fusarium keratoplasticum]|uniref:PfkB domain-containing protein n=1 Tax=Fusarium keratoplasticum TaxID=1328300 RepID=A0ACC0QRH6_9HYPO|nr:PfkB domain-containing protein [Fusarium keratoplasticum]KAI8665873.1 PfkB domain-containing protein [Fusarium keratoplasticum]